MDKRLILHIGVGKTGSSALQTGFARNAEILKSFGVSYPHNKYVEMARKGVPTSGNALPLAGFLNPNLTIDLDPAEGLTELERASEDPAVSAVLFSSEKLADAQPERIADLRRACERLGFRIVVVMYTRSVVDHAYAKYVQLVRVRYASSFHTYLNDSWRYQFGEPADAWADALGRSALVLKDYDACKSDLFGDFARTILVLDEDQVSALATTGTINRSLTRFEIKLLLELNKHLPTSRDALRLASEYLKILPEPIGRLQVWEDELELIADRSIQDRRHLQSRYSVVLPLHSPDIEILAGSEPPLEHQIQSLLNLMIAYLALKPPL